jgi:hypothetical protein
VFIIKEYAKYYTILFLLHLKLILYMIIFNSNYDWQQVDDEILSHQIRNKPIKKKNK